MVKRLIRHIKDLFHRVKVRATHTPSLREGAGGRLRSPSRVLGGLLFLLLTACSSDAPFTEPDTPSPPQPGTFTLFTRGEGTNTTSKTFKFQDGTEVAYDEMHDNELINNWTVVFIKKDNAGDEIEQVISNPEDLKPGDTYGFTPTVSDGYYDIVAFANMTDAQVSEMVLGEASSATSLSKSQSTSLDEIKNRTFNFEFKSDGTVDINLIPMSGYRQNVHIVKNSEVSSDDSGNNNKPNTIEVIRMLAKVEIIFYNPTENQINVSSLKFGNVQTNAESLMPDYKNLNDEACAVPSEENVTAEDIATVEITPTEQYVEPKGGIHKEIFYVRESDASKTNPDGGNFFMLTLNLILNETNTPVSEHYAATDQLLWINRNDHIVIPVTIQDYYVNWKVCYYPPIAGYPAVIEDSRPSEFYYFCDFKTPGEFEIKPEIVDPKGNPIVTGFTLKVDTEKISDEYSIFEVAPYVSFNGDEILGMVGGQNGDAVVPVTIEIASEGKSPISRTRNVYIRRSN